MGGNYGKFREEIQRKNGKKYGKFLKWKFWSKNTGKKIMMGEEITHFITKRIKLWENRTQNINAVF